MFDFNDTQINQLLNLPHGGDFSCTLFADFNLVNLIPLAISIQFLLPFFFYTNYFNPHKLPTDCSNERPDVYKQEWTKH